MSVTYVLYTYLFYYCLLVYCAYCFVRLFVVAVVLGEVVFFCWYTVASLFLLVLWVVGSILRGGPIELFHVTACAP